MCKRVQYNLYVYNYNNVSVRSFAVSEDLCNKTCLIFGEIHL